ncbi:MAG: hypothetical protein N3A69_04580, partial [Leptospiraceae bacterium]|nr:hypothetical protein [Leptospiraceae bacterium]
RYAQMSSISEDQFQFILNEKLSDSLLLKLLIQIENKIGAVLILTSELSGNILLIYSIFGNSPTIRRIQPFEKITNFMTDIQKAHKEGAMEFAISERIGRTIYRLLTPEIILSAVDSLKQKSFSQFKDTLIQGIIKETKLMNVQIEMDIEKTNSIQFLKKNSLKGIVPEVRNPFEETIEVQAQTINKTSSTSPNQPKTKVEIAIEEVTKNYKEVVKCQTVVSPVSGLTFEELKPGQKLLFLLPFRTPEERSRARRLGAVNQLGQNQPVIGEFIKLIVAENEYHILAKGPGNVLLNAFEERPVRLAFPKDSLSNLEEKTLKTALWIAGGFVVFILVLFFLYFR